MVINPLENWENLRYNIYENYYRKAGMNMANANMEALGFKKLTTEEIEAAGFNPFKMIGKDWMLVTAGDEISWNTMTASWGFMGIIWGKPAVMAVIRPQRYTKEFIDNSDCFTLSFFDEDMRSALLYCGKYSGRDVDKEKETGLKPICIDGSVSFEQAKTVVVCKKAYAQDMSENCFADKGAVSAWYPDNDYHTSYIGEIVSVYVK